MKDQFRRILDMVRKTGDTMVVTDPNGEDVFVVMNLEQYEMMLGMEGEDQEGQEGQKAELDIWRSMKPANGDGETWDLDKMNEKELADLEEQYKQFTNRNVKEAIKSTEESKKSESQDFGEEEFYLEPIE
jgi:PHD/YefM family antitoxin component YafN of YafNO toxin-antitoxin module